MRKSRPRPHSPWIQDHSRPENNQVQTWNTAPSRPDSPITYIGEKTSWLLWAKQTQNARTKINKPILQGGPNTDKVSWSPPQYPAFGTAILIPLTLESRRHKAQPPATQHAQGKPLANHICSESPSKPKSQCASSKAGRPSRRRTSDTCLSLKRCELQICLVKLLPTMVFEAPASTNKHHSLRAAAPTSSFGPPATTRLSNRCKLQETRPQQGGWRVTPPRH
jgi:hypothetical protein